MGMSAAPRGRRRLRVNIEGSKVMKTRKITVLILSMLLAMVPMLAACGSQGGGESADDGQNPIMNFVGSYGYNRANIFIGAEGQDGASATVTWGSSAAENSTWVMSGTFDPETLTFSYNDCVKTDYVYNEDGKVESQEEVYTGGHGTMVFSEGDPLTLTWNDDQEHIADGTVFEFTGATPEENSTGLANPWSEADTPEAAAEGAGVESFLIPEGAEIGLGTVDVTSYRYMDGIAEAVIEYPAAQVTVRKGLASATDEEGDISGDYNEYANTWTQNINGIEVTCSGNREGDATKTIWQSGDYLYSIIAEGLGGDTDYGLSADDLVTLAGGIE